VSALPEDFPASVFVVLHIPPFIDSKLPGILNAAGPLRAVHPGPMEDIRRGMIYVARPDLHMLIRKGSVFLRKGPKENRSRPSIDALFRSAAYSYGSRVIGVIMSGVLDDGTSGLWTIKQRGGVAVIQNPEEAWFSDMPANVMKQVDVDYLIQSSEMGPLLGKLVREPAGKEPKLSAEELKRLQTEIGIAGGDIAMEKGTVQLGELTPFTCPECHGALVKLREGENPRFRCHTGHAFSADALLAGISESNEEILWQAMRGFDETTMLLEHLGKHYADAGQRETAEQFFAKARQMAGRARSIHAAIMQEEMLSKDSLED
jgi:two-component system chemotaxis response regulator CheB